MAIFLCQSMIYNLKTSNRKFYMPMSLLSSPCLWKISQHLIIKYIMWTNIWNRYFKKVIFHPLGVINFSNFFITLPKTFQLSLGVAGKEILTFSALSRSCQFLPLSDRTIMLKVVEQANRSRHDTCSRHNVEIFYSVLDLKEFLLENFSAELSSPAGANSFRLGYIVGKSQRLTISNNSNLHEVYSSARNSWITLWAEPILKTAKETSSRGRKRTHTDTLLDDSHKGTQINTFQLYSLKYLSNLFTLFMCLLYRSLVDENSEATTFFSQTYASSFWNFYTDTPVRSELDLRPQSLHEKHGEDYAEFKLRAWTKMVVFYTQHNLLSFIP